MKHAISSLEYLLQIKGFGHGSSRFPMDNIYCESMEYSQGYMDGQKSIREYSDKVCKSMGLVNPVVHNGPWLRKVLDDVKASRSKMGGIGLMSSDSPPPQSPTIIKDDK